MKNFIAIACFAALSMPAFGIEPTDSNVVDSVSGFGFVDKIVIPVTPVKDQNKSGTCWSFAGTGFFENEILRNTGDTVDLSEMFVVRKCYEDKADRYVRLYGNCNFSPGGALPDVAYVLSKYGIVPEEVYRGLDYGEEKHSHGELHGALDGVVRAVVSKPDRHVTTAWRNALGGVLDAYLGPTPETFTYKGKTYTPQSYAASLGINPDEYIGITSFTHHPFYEPFILEICDNWLWDKYQNVPLDELKAIIDNALEKGYTVGWAADVSEDGFKWYEGVALMPKGVNENDLSGTELARWVKLSKSERNNEKYKFDGPVDEIEVTPELRQHMFDSQETTDDHGMVIVGTAVDRLGNKYYKVKNSWNTLQLYDGYIYVSEPYLLAKTVDIYVNKAAVPRDIAKKMGI